MTEFTFLFVTWYFDLSIFQAFETTSKRCLTFSFSSSNLGEKTYPMVMQHIQNANLLNYFKKEAKTLHMWEMKPES